MQTTPEVIAARPLICDVQPQGPKQGYQAWPTELFVFVVHVELVCET